MSIEQAATTSSVNGEGGVMTKMELDAAQGHEVESIGVDNNLDFVTWSVLPIHEEEEDEDIGDDNLNGIPIGGDEEERGGVGTRGERGGRGE